MSILQNFIQSSDEPKDIIHAAKEKLLIVLFVLFLPFRARKALLAQQVVMEYRDQWVCLALLDHLEYLERTETRPVTLDNSLHTNTTF